jgi:hypothetical protein
MEANMDQLTAFRQSLAETIAWCTAHATLAAPEWCLRTPALEPGQLDAQLSVKERQECVAHLVQTRSRLLHDAGVSPLIPATNLAGGHLLLFDPDGTLSDGAAAVSSGWFFDDDNIPPWDCWVLYVADPLTPVQQATEEARGRRLGRWSSMPSTAWTVDSWLGPSDYVVDPIPSWRRSYLVSWVAPLLIPLVQTGVVVNPESCIEWLADRDTPFTQALQALHLLV